MEEQADYITDAREMMGKGYRDDQRIVDNGDLRKYRIELPNLMDDSDLDVYEFRLLTHYKRVGRCTEGTRTTAKICRMSHTQVSKKRQSLSEKGWIELREVPLEGGGFAYDVTVIDRWLENFQKYTPRNPDLHPRKRGGDKEYEEEGNGSQKENVPSSQDDDAGKILTLWTNLHTFLIPTHANLILCSVDEWREHIERLPAGHPDKKLDTVAVFENAMKITAKNARNPHSISYMDQVVKNWIENGYGYNPNDKPKSFEDALKEAGYA